MDFKYYLQSVGGWLLTSGLRILLILLLMIIALPLAKLLSMRLFKPFQKATDDVEMKKRGVLTDPIAPR